MDDARNIPAEPGPSDGETPDQWFSRRLRQPPKRGLSAEAIAYLEENREAIADYNAWYEKNGSPLDRYRTMHGPLRRISDR